MLQIMKAKVNGKDGFICTTIVNSRPENVVFTDVKDILSLLENM